MATIPPFSNLDESPIPQRSELGLDFSILNSLSSSHNIRPPRNLKIIVPAITSPRPLAMKISPKGSTKLGNQLSASLTNSEQIDPLEKVRKALKCDKRTTEEAIVIYKHLENTEFFQQFRANNNTKLHETDALLYLAQHLTYEQCSAGKLIIKEGDSSTDKLYIILTGEMYIVSKKNDSSTKERNRPDHSAQEQVSPQTLKKPINLTINSGRQLKTSKTINIQRGAFNLDRPDKKDTEPENLAVKAIVSPRGKQQVANFSQALEGELLSYELPKLSKVLSSPCNVLDQDKVESNIRDQSKSIKASGFSLFGRARTISQGTKVNFQPPKPIADKSNEALIEEDSDNEDDTRRIVTQYGYVISQLYKGDHFGETALYTNSKRNAGAVANTSCEFITISEDLLSFVRRRFEKTNTRKLNFMMDYFPGMENLRHRNLLGQLLPLLEDTKFDVNVNLTVQGNKSNYFYVIIDGFCDLYIKLLQDPKYNRLQQYGDQGDQNRQDGIVVCRISPGMFVGEEILFNSTGEYDFTVKAASPQVNVFAINKDSFTRVFPKAIQQSLQEVYLMKSKHYVDSGTERTNLKNVYMPLVKPLLTKKTGISPRNFPFKETSLRLPERSPSSDHLLASDSSTPRTLAVKSRLSPFFRTSTVSNSLEPNENVLRSPGLKPLKNTSISHTKALGTPLTTRGCNTPERSPTLSDLKLGLENEVKSAISRRFTKETPLLDLVKTESCKEGKVHPVPKLSLKSIHCEEKQPLTSRLLGKLKVSKSRSARMKWDNVGFNLDLEKIRKSIHNQEELDSPVDKIVMRGKPEGIERSQPLSVRNRIDNVNMNDGGTFMTNLGYFVPDSAPHTSMKKNKSKKNFTNASLTGQYQYTLRNTSEQIIRTNSEKEVLKLGEVSLEAGFLSGMYSKTNIRLNSER